MRDVCQMPFLNGRLLINLLLIEASGLQGAAILDPSRVSFLVVLISKTCFLGGKFAPSSILDLNYSF